MKSQNPTAKKPGKSVPKSKEILFGQSKKEITNESNGLDASKQILTQPNPIEMRRKQNCLYEIVELANTLKDDDKVNGLTFKQIIISIEAKLTEFQERLENRDNLQELNSHLQKLQNLQPNSYCPNNQQINQKKDESNQNNNSGFTRNQSQASLSQNDNAGILNAQEKVKSPQVKRSVSKQTSINIGVSSQQIIQDNNKITALETRLKSYEDNLLKLSQEFQEQLIVNNQKLDKTIKGLNERYFAYSTINLQQQFNEITESQKSLITHLQQQSKDITETNNVLNKLKQSQDAQIIEVDNKIEHVLKQNNENLFRIQSLSSSLQTIDSDFIVILKCYKDILNEIYKIDLLEQQQKKIVCLLQDE